MRKNGTIAALMILFALGAITVSCNKEQTAKCRKATITAVEKDGGDDDEDPVIRGRVKKTNNSVIVNATVETVMYGTNASQGTVYTDSLGEFQQKVKAGIYYFKVLVPGETIPYVTDTVHVNKDVEITITVE